MLHAYAKRKKIHFLRSTSLSAESESRKFSVLWAQHKAPPAECPMIDPRVDGKGNNCPTQLGNRSSGDLDLPAMDVPNQAERLSIRAKRQQLYL
jgi:hypothetical protein